MIVEKLAYCWMLLGKRPTLAAVVLHTRPTRLALAVAVVVHTRRRRCLPNKVYVAVVVVMVTTMTTLLSTAVAVMEAAHRADKDWFAAVDRDSYYYEQKMM